jgi:WD40 repeat protein
MGGRTQTRLGAALLLGLTALCLVAPQVWRTRGASAAGLATFGKSSVGGSVDVFASERKRVNRYALPEAGSATKLTIYLQPTATSGQQVLKGVIYSDASGRPQALLGVSEQLTVKSTNAAGWYDMKFATPVQLAAGNYWIGVITGVTSYVTAFRYESIANSRDYNNNAYASGPTNPFGSVTTNAEQMSLYATYAPNAHVPPPTNITPPMISGTAQQGQTLTEAHGKWENEPTSFTYQWLQCDSSGNNCLTISGATKQTYLQVAADVEHTIKVQEIATNDGGSSGPATSAVTAVVIAGSVPPPTSEAPPTITGTAQQGQTLTELHGKWANEPTSFTYQWLQCDSLGIGCLPISGATKQTYEVAAADVEHTIEVQETASNEGGPSSPATSAPSAVVSAASRVQHLEYVFVDGLISVYDMDQQQKLVKTINMPQTLADTRGATVSPSTHMLFLSFGGDGGAQGNGSVLAYDLVAEKVVWEVHLPTPIDSGAVSPDGKRLYMPTGENDKSGIWNILDTSNGAIIGTIHGGTGAHNTIVSNDGHYVYLGGRDYNYLDVYDTTTGNVRSIGPLAGGVRPFTVNGTNTLAFTTATRFLGFQVSSLTTGNVLFTVSFGSIPSGFPLSAPSHGASLSPDEKQLYVIDAVHKEVHVFDVSRVAEGVAPTELGTVPAPQLNVGKLSPCRYDCVRGGWVQHSLDGRFVYVPTTGEVIEAATRKVVTTLSTLANTKKSLEVDWANGVPIATSGRNGVGHVG